MCNCKQDCGCKPNKCFPCADECEVRITTDCATVPVELPNIGSDQDESLTTVLELIDEFLAQTPPTPQISITNVGDGEELFKGQSNLGNYEFRTISAGSDAITVTQTGDNIVIDVDIPELPQRTYTASNLGTGAVLYKDSTITPSNTQFNFKTLSSTTLSVTVGENTISIDTPETAMVPALYVNNQYVPSYSEFLAGNTKGLGTFAKPFTDTVNYTNPTTLVQTPNTAIQNALDAYQGTGTGTRLNPQLLGQRIIVQNNNSNYTFLGDFNYSGIYLVNQANIISTTAGYLIDMNNSANFDTNTSTATIFKEPGSNLEIRGLGFINDGNLIATQTFQTGRTLKLLGQGRIISEVNNINNYIVDADGDSDANGVIGNNNDGTVAIAIEGTLTSVYGGIYKVGGKSLITVSGQLESSNLNTTVNTALQAFRQTGGNVRITDGSTIISFGGARTNVFTFQPTNGFTPKLETRDINLQGYGVNWFNKLNTNLSDFEMLGTKTQFFSGSQLFNSPNLWAVNFQSNIISNIGIDFTKVDFTKGNTVSAVNTIGGNVLETLVRYNNRLLAEVALPPYSAFINMADTPISSGTGKWFRDITLPTA